jgi:hypothetical protein
MERRRACQIDIASVPQVNSVCVPRTDLLAQWYILHGGAAAEVLGSTLTARFFRWHPNFSGWTNNASKVRGLGACAMLSNCCFR